jgi:hypothetical protein
MANLDFGPHMERVMGAVGDTEDGNEEVTITNYTDSGNTKRGGETIWDDNIVTVQKAVVELEQSAFNKETSGTEHLYDARIFVPKGTFVFEADQDHKESEINARGNDYIVEQKDTQNGMIRLLCRVKR